uniref:SAM domain-containing protein n=1 Tax=Photinus pyralis TaxID=7054 RepID=A0A1Y1LUZ3_PHOPY
MYADVESLLEDWGLPQLIETFKNNDIDLSNFFLLEESLIKELIPSIGIRAKFLSLFKRAKELENSSIVVHEVVQAVDDETSNLIQANMEFESNSENRERNEQYFIIPQQHRPAAEIGLENMLKKIQLPEFDLKTLLCTSVFGSEILEYYNKNKFLDMKRRNKLTEIIIKHVFDYVAKYRLTPEDYNVLASKIITLFPKETASTYYVPAIRKRDSITRKPILARGKLVDKCRNLLHDCGPSVIIRKRKSSYLDEDDSYGHTKERQIVLESDELKNDMIWLQNRHEPWDEVLTKWKNTYGLRKLSTAATVREFFEEWPILKKDNSEVLINLDFEREYPQSTLKLILDWESAFQKIFEYKSLTIKDKFCEELITLLNSEGITEDSTFAAQISILAYLVPPKGKINLGSKNLWKFSSAEAVNSIICHAKIPGDVDEIIRKNKETAAIKKQTVQPYMIVEGPSLKQLNNFYIVVDELRYQTKSAKQAFDNVFKLFFCNKREISCPRRTYLPNYSEGHLSYKYSSR